jgi:Lon-like protease
MTDPERHGLRPDSSTTVPPAPPPPAPPQARRRWLRRLPWIAGPIAALLVAMWGVKLPYYSEGPGPARDVEPLIRIGGHQEFQSAGHFILTSVSFVQLNVFGAIASWIDPNRSIVSQSAFVYPGETQQEANQRAISEMDQSKIDASIVVLSRVAGYPRAHGRGVLVEGVYGPGCPADGRLFPGDRLQALNNRPILSVFDFHRRLERMPASAPVRLRGTAGGRQFTTTIRRRRCLGSKRPLIGIAPVPSFPFGISISSGDIGGPSAGLMWSLGLYDILTPGDLTHGRTIAGTGTISADGRVGPIGGVEDKIAAARAAGANLFFVPVQNYRDAKQAAGSMRLVPVRTFGQAVRALRRLRSASSTAAEIR